MKCLKHNMNTTSHKFLDLVRVFNTLVGIDLLLSVLTGDAKVLAKMSANFSCSGTCSRKI